MKPGEARSHFFLTHFSKNLPDPSPGSGSPFAPIQLRHADTDDELNPSQVS